MDRRRRIGDVVGRDIEIPFPQFGRDTQVIIDFERGDVLAIRAGAEVDVGGPNAGVENLLVGEIELGLHSRLLRRVRDAAVDILRQQRRGAAQRNVTFGVGRECGRHEKHRRQ